MRSSEGRAWTCARGSSRPCRAVASVPAYQSWWQPGLEACTALAGRAHCGLRTRLPRPPHCRPTACSWPPGPPHSARRGSEKLSTMDDLVREKDEIIKQASRRGGGGGGREGGREVNGAAGCRLAPPKRGQTLAGAERLPCSGLLGAGQAADCGRRQLRRRQVMAEGEALSKKQLAQEQTIKKLRGQARELQAQVLGAGRRLARGWGLAGVRGRGGRCQRCWQGPCHATCMLPIRRSLSCPGLHPDHASPARCFRLSTRGRSRS